MTTQTNAKHQDGMPLDGATYGAAVRERWSDAGIWDYLRYDDRGDLWLGGLRVQDAVDRYGAPIEIVDTTLVERRCADWAALAGSVADRLGYGGRLGYLYAAKANMASEVAHAAYRSGWSAETSSRQDLLHLRWLRGHGLLPEGLRVVCNGFKLPRSDYAMPEAADLGPTARAGQSRSVAAGARAHADAEPGIASEVVLPPADGGRVLRSETYAESILELARDGWNITPILDSGELDTFLEPGVPLMTVGLRMKHGRVSSLAELDGLVSRFGMTRDELRATAARIDDAPHLRFTVLHAMVGAAEEIPVDRFAAALEVAGEVWIDLRLRHPSLTELNIGGGIPPLSEPYDHRGFLERVLGRLIVRCASAGVAPPDVTFELGSLVAAECGFHVFPIIQTKRNHSGPSDDIADWSIVDGGLMAAIPDMLIIGKAFRILAVEHADRPPRRTRLGDVTCDSDGRYPPKAFGEQADVLLPDAPGPTHVLIQGVGAYQEILAGVRGAHHCGLLEAPELILERRSDGRVHGRLMPRQTPDSAAELLGYVAGTVEPLRAAMSRPEVAS